MNRVLLEGVFFPFYHTAKRTGVLHGLRNLEASQWLSRHDLESLQAKKLASLMRHCWERVPFYRDRMESAGVSLERIGEPGEFQKVPLLSKDEIRGNLDRMVARGDKSWELIPNSTSGSTGEALRFYVDRGSWAMGRATGIRSQTWVGVGLGERLASLWGAPMDVAKGRALRGRVHAWVTNTIMLSSYQLSDQRMEEYAQRLRAFRPAVLSTYPGPAAAFGEFLIARGIKIPSLRAIVSSAETLHDWQKEIIERAFECPVYNRYGSREFGVVAQECSERRGLHVNSERVLLEVLRQDGSAAEPGETGELVITNLDCYGFPLVRYRIGDAGAMSDAGCNCGRGLPTLCRVEGRTLDVIRTPNGTRVGGTFWTLLFRSRPGIRAFQVVQEEIGRVLVRYVRDSSADVVPLEHFRDRIREQCGPELNVDFEETAEIPLTKSGKMRFVVSKIGSHS